MTQATDRPAATLQSWPNPKEGRAYRVRCVIEAFTCLCPLTGLPDYGALTIEYTPGRAIVELKSLKRYAETFRDRRISHEALVNVVLDDLLALLDPVWMQVVGTFAVRGGIATAVTAEHEQGVTAQP